MSKAIASPVCIFLPRPAAYEVGTAGFAISVIAPLVCGSDNMRPKLLLQKEIRARAKR